MIGCGPVMTGECIKTQLSPTNLIFNLKQIHNLTVLYHCILKKKGFFIISFTLSYAGLILILSCLLALSHSHQFPFYLQPLSFFCGIMVAYTYTLTIAICSRSFLM